MLALAMAVVAALPAAAQETGGVRVNVIGAGGRDQPGVGVTVRPVLVDGTSATQLGTQGTTDQNGNVSFGDLPKGLYEVTADGRGSTYVRVQPGLNPAIGFDRRTMPVTSFGNDRLAALVEQANKAAAACDKPSYDAARAELDRLEAMVTANIARLDEIISEFETDTGYQANLEQLRSLWRTVERAMVRLGRTPTGQAARAGAPIDPQAAKLGDFLIAMEAREKLRLQLEAIRAARGRIQPLRADCDRRTGALPGVPAGTIVPGSPTPGQVKPVSWTGSQAFYVGIEGGVQRVERPSTSFFRVDSGGQFARFPALKFDNDETVAVARGMVGYRLPTPELKQGSAIGVELHGWYYAGSSRGSQSEFQPGPGESTGLFSPATQAFPFGGYASGQPLTDISYQSDYKNYGGELRLQRWCDYSFGTMNVMLEPWLGFRLGRVTSNQSLQLGIGNPAFASFSQQSDIDSTFFGPVLGVGARFDVGGGVFLFGKAGVSLDFHRGSGSWSTIVPLVDGDQARSAKLSDNKTGYSVSGALGLGYRWENIELRASGEFAHTNASPFLKFATPEDTGSGTGGAKIGYGNQTNYGAGLSFRMEF